MVSFIVDPLSGSGTLISHAGTHPPFSFLFGVRVGRRFSLLSFPFCGGPSPSETIVFPFLFRNWDAEKSTFFFSFFFPILTPANAILPHSKEWKIARLPLLWSQSANYFLSFSRPKTMRHSGQRFPLFSLKGLISLFVLCSFLPPRYVEANL